MEQEFIVSHNTVNFITHPDKPIDQMIAPLAFDYDKKRKEYKFVKDQKEKWQFKAPDPIVKVTETISKKDAPRIFWLDIQDFDFDLNWRTILVAEFPHVESIGNSTKVIEYSAFEESQARCEKYKVALEKIIYREHGLGSSAELALEALDIKEIKRYLCPKHFCNLNLGRKPVTLNSKKCSICKYKLRGKK